MSRVFLRETKTADREVDITDGSLTVWRCMSKGTMDIKLENIHVLFLSLLLQRKTFPVFPRNPEGIRSVGTDIRTGINQPIRMLLMFA